MGVAVEGMETTGIEAGNVILDFLLALGASQNDLCIEV